MIYNPMIAMLFLLSVPESVVWLMAVNKRAEAENVLQKLARYNGIKIDGPVLKQVMLRWIICPITSHPE